MKERIITEAGHLFNQLGVRTVRLEDVANQLGISKKTLYQHFVDKEALVRQVLETQLDENLREANAIHAQTANPIVSALLIWDRLIRYRQTTNPNMLRDIERHYPTVWRMFQTFRATYINIILVTNFREGIEQGLYRNDLDETALAWLWAEESQLEVPFEGAETAFKHHFVRGLLTQKGLALYESLAVKQTGTTN
ncbi:TetR/AcrR family transcriptional regulator [Spirosoma pollinicola]|uniref:TetR/AcrR family transcriptional regulator n=1 Tax=Spirosoma pollinicola TaxID=2057025 RepID=A0A2K8Z3V1_9BACT|nr:TetR/AcrR family transcriptional regulator [Spirosoma pollinicola]AUD04553.1 TetR/AcrR family transcriptional regulator [Spirosoma pollinicola]